MRIAVALAVAIVLPAVTTAQDNPVERYGAAKDRANAATVRARVVADAAREVR